MRHGDANRNDHRRCPSLNNDAVAATSLTGRVLVIHRKAENGRAED